MSWSRRGPINHYQRWRPHGEFQGFQVFAEYVVHLGVGIVLTIVGVVVLLLEGVISLDFYDTFLHY